MDNLTQEQVTKFRLSDNKVAESKWDEVLLIEDLQALKETGYSVLDIPGFSESDIDKLLKSIQDDAGLKDRDHVPAKQKNRLTSNGTFLVLACPG